MARSEATRIIGRAEPRQLLQQAALASASGRRTAVFVSGEAGVGKTSLVRSALESLTDTATLVGWGTCWHGDGAPGFWPWMQALDDLTDGVGRQTAVAAAGQDRDLLAVLVRELGPAVDLTADPDRSRPLLLDAAVRWLERLAEGRHVVLVLDDLQWADPSTLDLLGHLVAAPLAARLMVVGVYRHDEIAPDTATRLADLGSRTEHVRLGGLGIEEVRELLATICGDEQARSLAAALHDRTGGHPLFVRELARLPEVGVGGPLPTAVSGALGRRLDLLPVDTLRVLDVASVLGNRLLPDVLGLAVDESPAVVVERLDPALTAGIVRTGPEDELWFTHDLFRETLYSRLRLAERAQLHARVGEALAARHSRGVRVPPSDLARHFTHAVTVADPALALHWAREAALDERRRAAFTEAAAHLRRVRAALADAGWAVAPDTLVRVLLDEADAQARSGEPDIARDVLGEAAAAAADPRQEADVALAVQRLGARFAAPRDEILAQLESALASVSGHDVMRQAQVTAALARELQHSVAEDRRRAGPLSEEALALGRTSEDDETLAACLLARHDALWEPGTGVARSVLGHEIVEVATRLGDPDRLAEGLILEANGLLEAGSPGFRPVLDRWLGLLDARNEPRDRYLAQTRRAALALLEADADRAEELMYAAARLGARIHEPDTGNVLMSQRVALARVRDQPEELVALAADAVRHWTGAPGAGARGRGRRARGGRGGGGRRS